MKWMLVSAIVGSTITCDLLQSWDMRRHGEVSDFRVLSVAAWFRRWPMSLAVVFMATSFFALLQLLRVAELSFAVPATAANIVFETLLARVVLKETVQPRRWLGAILVACGVALLARS